MTTAKKDNAAATKAAKFAQLRQRALDSGVGNAPRMKVNKDSYVLGKEYGFDPEINVPSPSLEDVLLIERAMQSGDVWNVASAILGDSNAVRVLRALDKEFDPDEAAQVLAGILLDAIEHFYGPGAFDTVSGFTRLR